MMAHQAKASVGAPTSEGCTLPGGHNPTVTLSVSIVTFASDLALLAKGVASLTKAVNQAYQQEVLSQAHLTLIDNGPGEQYCQPLEQILGSWNKQGTPCLPAQLLTGQGNIGFGAGHNLAINQSMADMHLVLNPDVILAPDAIVNGIAFLLAHPRVGALAPLVESSPGVRQYLCRRYPTILDLFLRGFAPPPIRRLFQKRLAAVELRDRCGAEADSEIEIISGCFMLYRRELLQQLGGFADHYFLYFEDFDLSLRTRQLARLAYVPSVCILHSGGNASRKGWRHIRMFIASAWTFFNQHGWRVW